MNVAVIIAGGVGARMGENIPKQFIEIYDKPIIAYTLISFEEHPLIDAIEVVCIEGWEDKIKECRDKYGLSKVKWITKGGSSAQESIYNGLKNLKGEISENDIVIIHDGIRPLVAQNVLTDVIEVAKEKGNAVTSLPYNEQIFVVDEDDNSTTTKYIPRDTLRRVATPQAYRFEKILWAYDKAFAENIGIGPSTYANTLMVELGEKLNLALGSDANIKLTTKQDLDIFKGYLTSEKENWLK